MLLGRFLGISKFSNFPILVLFLLYSLLPAAQTIEKDLVNLYVDLKLIGIGYEKDTLSQRNLQGALFRKYLFTPQKFHEEIGIMRNSPTLWMGFQEQVLQRIDEIETQYLQSKQGE